MSTTSDTRPDIIAVMSTWAGNLIRLARHDAGLSQRVLARRAGTSGGPVGVRGGAQVA